MATFRSFNSMLNEYLAYDLLTEELAKRNFFIEKVEKDDKWKDGPLIVPFKGASASSFRYGKLTNEDDISENEYVRGQVSGYKEIWGTMFWHSRDLKEHDGKVSEASFLKNLPGQIEDFMDDMKQVVSINLLTGAHFAKLTVDGTITGTIVVDRPERFTLKQKVYVDDDNSPPIAGYVQTIDVNTSTITLDTTRAGGVDVDLSPYTVAQNAKVYVDGAETAANTFTSLKSQLLSLANGGSAQLFGQSKLAYPYLQSINHNGAAFTATTLLDGVFDAWTRQKQLGKGSATDVVMSYKHLGNIMKNIEASAGAYKNVKTKATIYGYTEIEVVGVKGSLIVVGVHEMDDDVMFLIDWKAMKLHSNGFFRKEVTPEGLSYYTIRTEDGYKYITDICFYGELVVNKPTACGIIYGINY